jgi:predicted permease
MEDAGSWWLVAIARLKSGVARTQAQSGVSLLFFNEMVHGAKPMSKAEDAPSIQLLPVQTGLTGSRDDLSKPLYVLMLAVGIVLLIACANVAGLMLARATARQREIAVRLALGASRGRVARQMLTESLTISCAGGLLGIVLAFWSARALLAFLTGSSDRPSGFSAEIDLRVLAFTAGASIVTGILFGLAPALRSMRVDLTPALKAGARSSGKANVGRGWFNSGNALVVAQVALTVVVLVGAGLMVHTLKNLRGIDPGFDTNNILNFNVDSTLTTYTGDRLGQFYRELRDRFREIPGVLSAGYSDSPLLSGSLGMTSFHFHGNRDEKESSADILGVGPGFFSTMKMPLTAGRDFAPREYAADVEEAGPLCPNAPKAVVVNESFVRIFFPNGNALGQRFGADNPATPDPKRCKNLGWEVVGVVRDAKYNDLRRKINATIYTPSGESGTFELRTAGDPRTVIPAVRGILAHSGFDLPIFGIKTESQSIDELLFTERLIARLASLFGLLALLLACIGLYGLLSYDVTRRTREIGIRMALGAPSGDVLGRVVRHGIALVAIGAAVGTAASISLTRYLGSLLYNVNPSDPLALTAVTVLLLVVALAACYIPARRATRVDPLVALRYE